MADIEKNVTEEVTEKKDAKATETKDAKAAKAAAKAAAKKNKTPLGKRIKKALKEFKAEFKKIVWSSRRNTFVNTVLVCVVMTVVAVAIGLLDLGFSKLLEWLASLV
ncbi:MAG: preprotein translocase subunit SecE [Ruminococcaceae bacterium]|nr:preprotein translocase subunit SecE [Oscillospiraceae bacterium]